MNPLACRCFDPQAARSAFFVQPVGIDTTHQRFGDVSLWTCQQCGTRWLHYLVEYEAFTASGRWFRGLILSAPRETPIPSAAIAYLEGLPWYFLGGSYFGSTGMRGAGKIQADLY